jgi:putative restriction endonuclease
MLLSIFAEDGSPISASCTISGSLTEWSVIIESRGGTRGTFGERNSEYALGFLLVLQRLASVNAVLLDAILESRKLVSSEVPLSARQLKPIGLNFPHALGSIPVSHVAGLLRKAQTNVGTERTKGGGNSTRRIRLQIRLPHSLPLSFEEFVTGKKVTQSFGFVTTGEIQELTDAIEFNPFNIADARQHTLSSIAIRQGQTKFRNALLLAYQRRCAISGCDAEPVLEAAHITPFRGQDTNHIQNGLLLRSDIHTLFDRGLLGINPFTWRVLLHKSILGTQYSVLQNIEFMFPKNQSQRPSPDALWLHLKGAGLDSL